LDKTTPMGALMDRFEHLKASICAKVERPLPVIKHQFGYMKVRYPGAGQEHGAVAYAVCAE
jgi:IS5 family transposase